MKKTNGFSLVELVASLAIVMALSFIALPYGFELYRAQEKAQVMQTLKHLRIALKQFADDHNGSYPRSLESLVLTGYLKEIPKNIMTDKIDWHIAGRSYHQVSEFIDPGITTELTATWNIHNYWARSEYWVKNASTAQFSDWKFIMPVNPARPGPYKDKIPGVKSVYASYWGVCNVRCSTPLGIDPEENIHGTIEAVTGAIDYQH